jgi:hypothetical protein
MADPKNFVVENDSLGLIVECTHPECRRNGRGHYARFGARVTVAEVIEVMDTHDRLEGDHDSEPDPADAGAFVGVKVCDQIPCRCGPNEVCN